MKPIKRSKFSRAWKATFKNEYPDNKLDYKDALAGAGYMAAGAAAGAVTGAITKFNPVAGAAIGSLSYPMDKFRDFRKNYKSLKEQRSFINTLLRKDQPTSKDNNSMKQPLNELSTALLQRYLKKAKESKRNIHSNNRYWAKKVIAKGEAGELEGDTKFKKKAETKLNRNIRKGRNRNLGIERAERDVNYDHDPAVKQFPDFLGRKTANSNKGMRGRPKSHATKRNQRNSAMYNAAMTKEYGPAMHEDTIPSSLLLQSLLSDKPANAQELFESIMINKLQERIDDYKQVIAETMFDGGEGDEDDIPYDEEDNDSSEIEIEDEVIDLDNLTDEELEDLLNSIDDQEQYEESEDEFESQ